MSALRGIVLVISLALVSGTEEDLLNRAITTASRVNVCNGGKTEYCNPNWVPFANMDQALLGYDSVVGDPFAKDGDPGFKAKLFNAVSADKVGRMSMDAGITATDMLECQTSESSVAASNFKEYARATKFSGSVDASLEVDILGFGANVGYKLNHESESARKFFASGKNVMIISQANCLLHKVNLNQMVLPQFTSTFIDTLKQMQAADNPTRQKLLFKKFYDTYGTHYITEARFGAKVIVRTKINKSKMSSEEIKKSSTCHSVNAGASYGGASLSASTDICSAKNSENKQGNSQENSQSSVISIGSKPMKDGLSWSKQEFTEPQIIGMDKAPLSTLISDRHLKAYGINAGLINKWFLPLMSDFCNNMNKQLPSSQKITCTHKSGCGIDDNCSLDEICTSTVDGGYVCQLSPAAKKGKPAVMFVVKGETTASQMEVVDVVNNGKTCQKVPAFPQTQSNTQVFPAYGSKLPKFLAGHSLYELKPKATMWTKKTVSLDPFVGDYQTFDVGDLGLWMVPFNWGEGSPSKILDLGLVWKGMSHNFEGRIWSGFSVHQESSSHFYFSGGKLFDNLKQANDPALKVVPNREVFLFNILTQKWTKVADLPGPLSQHAMGIVSSRPHGRELICTSGLDDKDRINTKTYLLNLKTKLWREGPAFPKDNSITFDRPTMLSYTDTVIVFGGQSQMNRGQDQIVQYNPDISLWSKRANTLPSTNGPMFVTSFSDMTCN